MAALPCFCLLVLVVFAGGAAAADYTVTAGGSIQDAINNAIDGDTIYVDPGAYIENVEVNKTVDLFGAGAVVMAADISTPVFFVSADAADIGGFTIHGSTYNAGIYVGGANDTTIANTTVHNNYIGINVRDSDRVTITHNSVMSNGCTGIALRRSCNNATIAHNIVTLNLCSGVFLEDYCNHSIITDNSVTHNEASGIGLYRFCSHATIEDNRISHNDGSHNDGRHGISLYNGCDHSVIRNNTVDHTGAGSGIWVCTSHNNLVENNIVDSNTGLYSGLTIYSANENTVTGNIVTNSMPYDLHMRFADNNLIYNNYFGTTDGVMLSSGNTWNVTRTAGPNIVGGLEIGGNYWRNYNGTDNDSDGFGDTSYGISGCLNHDLLPLVMPGMCGDVDRNGHVSANDAVEAYLRAVNPSYLVGSVWAADADGNKDISANDVVEIYRSAVDPCYVLHCVGT